MNLTPRVSIIMRAKNSDWVIGEALAGLFAQTYTNFELIVVDSGSTDKTLEFVARWPHRLIQIKPEDYIPGTVLNNAAKEARGELVVFQNSDAVPLATDALERLVAAFDDPKVQAAFARQVPRPDADGWVRRDYALSFPASGAAPDWLPFSQVFSAIRATALAEQPFYTAAWGSEDTEWGVAVKKRGWKIAYVPEALVMHSHNYTLRQLYGRRFIEGEADAFIYGGSDSVPALVKRTLASIAHDSLWLLKQRDLAGLALTPARRMAYQWGYYKGKRHGAERVKNQIDDVATGQKVVLDRHESVRKAA